jgi:tripartite-type tricarboxylate transporter receptor subunit TctC
MPASSAFVALPGAQPNLPLDLPRDFLPVGFVALQPFFLWVGSQVPAKTLPEFIALAKEKPGQLAFAATGRGTLSHLTGEGLQQHANIKLQLVPYTGGTAQALNDVIAGRIPMVIDAYPPLVGAMQAGHVRPLAVGSDKRLAAFPDLATMQETLPGFRSNGWLALVAPLGTPDAIVQKLNADLRAAVLDPVTKERLETTGNFPNPMSPPELLTFIRGEQQMWKPVVEAIARTPQ